MQKNLHTKANAAAQFTNLPRLAPCRPGSDGAASASASARCTDLVSKVAFAIVLTHIAFKVPLGVTLAHVTPKVSTQQL